MTAKTLELREKETKLADAKQWRSTLVSVQTELQRLLDLLPRRRNFAEHQRFQELTEALKLIDIGLTRNERVLLDVMQPLVSRPGLLRTDATIEELGAECKALRKHVKRWPTPDTQNKFKYTGKPNKCYREGKYLEPGDVIVLNESAATALADMFAPV
jgi:hypothetical protein